MTGEEFGKSLIDLLNEFYRSNDKPIEVIDMVQVESGMTSPMSVGLMANFRIKHRKESDLDAEAIIAEVTSYYDELFKSEGDEEDEG